jgi:hypothetical protein
MMPPMQLFRLGVLVFALLLCGCANSAPPLGHWFAPDAAAQVTLGPAPGTNGAAQLATTTHYKIYTTIKDSAFVERIAQLMEGSLTAYRTLAPGTPETRTQMECYIFQERFQWAEFTREHTGAMASVYLKINRGGYTMPGGWYVSYNIGEANTLSIAAHEGWHQFLVYHFRASLPRFLEEGLATMFEGVQFKDGLPYYNLSINQNRAIALRTALENNTTWELSDLLGMNAGDIVSQRGEKIDAWYAQAWALGRFLWDGDGGSHRAALQQILADTAKAKVFDPTGPHFDRRFGWTQQGVKAMLEHYLQMDFAQIDDNYKAFCRHVAYDELPAMSEMP